MILLAAAALAAVAGCAAPIEPGVYSREMFDASSPHYRAFPMPVADACEAARRALLSNGYVVGRANADGVSGRKSFQPAADTHVEIEFHVVCAPEGRDRTTLFVNAVQDRFALKKTSSSASLGVGPVGSVSLPFGSSSDSMVRIASETIPTPVFYERYFALVEHYLAQRDDKMSVDDAREPGVASQPTAPDRVGNESP